MEPFWSKSGNLLIFPWYALGAIQAIFTSLVGQHLGDIIFALYLMHGRTQVILEPIVLPHLLALVHGTKSAGMWQYTGVWFCSLVILVPITICISDGFWRFVDVRSIQFARWIENSCIQEAPKGYTPLEAGGLAGWQAEYPFLQDTNSSDTLFVSSRPAMPVFAFCIRLRHALT